MLKSIVSVCLITVVTAHQNFHQFWVNDVTPGYHTGIRMPPSNNPVTDVKSNDIVCNVGGTSGAGVATVPVNAGDKITVQWDQSSHPGPITHFLFGPVGSASAATGVGQWTKIDELDYVNGKWANEIMSVADMKYSFKLPANLASGEYLLRSEMLALHASRELNGAQFYVGCAQLKITGPGGNCSPKITLPGAYNARDNNILIPDFYFGFVASTFSAPGGPVATCARGSGGPVPTTPATVTTRPAVTTRPTVTTRPAVTTARTTPGAVTTVRQTTLATTTRPATGGGVALYGQCGGKGYTGSTVCVSGGVCKATNEFYSQCLPA